MDNKPTDFISEETPNQEVMTTDNEPKSNKKKLVFGFGGLMAVFIVAGATYGILSLSLAQKPTTLSKADTVKKDTAESIDSQVQAYMNSEQKIEDSIGTAESQAAVEDANTTQSLEGSYDF